MAVRLDNLDLASRRVTPLTDRTCTSGNYRVRCQVADTAPRAYFVRMLMDGVPKGSRKLALRKWTST